MKQPDPSKNRGIRSGIIGRTLVALMFSKKSRSPIIEETAHGSVSLSFGEQTGCSRPSHSYLFCIRTLVGVLFAGAAVFLGVCLYNAQVAGRRLAAAEHSLHKLRTELWESCREAESYRLTGRTDNARGFARHAEAMVEILGRLRIEFGSDPRGQALCDQFALSWDRADSLAKKSIHATALGAAALNALRHNTESASGFLQPAAVEAFALRNPPLLARRVSAASRIEANIRETCRLTEQLAATPVAGSEETPTLEAVKTKVSEYISCIHQLGRSFSALIFAQDEASAINWERCWRQAAAASEDAIRLNYESREFSRRLTAALKTTDQLIASRLEPYRVTKLEGNARSLLQSLAWPGALFVVCAATLLFTSYQPRLSRFSSRRFHSSLHATNQ